MLTMVKLGGSLITDKRVEGSFRAPVMTRLAEEIAAAQSLRPDLRLILGHGSGSFGHVTAQHYGTAQGVWTPEGWRGFARVANIAAELNTLVTRTLERAGVPVWRIQPSASAISSSGVIQNMAIEPIHQALLHDLVPLVYGDVSLDDALGGTIISTETIFVHLAGRLEIDEILLVGDVDGVYDVEGRVVPTITPSQFERVKADIGGSAGTDVTGGMYSKVSDMLRLVQKHPNLRIRIFGGTREGELQSALLGSADSGTLLKADAPPST